MSARSVAARALLPLGQPIFFMLTGDAKDPPDLSVSVAARVYAAGVLMYGQSPNARRLIVTAFGRRA